MPTGGGSSTTSSNQHLGQEPLPSAEQDRHDRHDEHDRRRRKSRSGSRERRRDRRDASRSGSRERRRDRRDASRGRSRSGSRERRERGSSRPSREPHGRTLADALRAGNRVDQPSFERLCEDPKWQGVLLGASSDGQSVCVKYGMEPIDVIAQNYANGACGAGPAGLAQLHGDFMEVRDVPADELDQLQPSLEFARAPGETSRWAVVFRAVVVETAAEHAVLHGDMLLPLKLVRERRSHLKRWDVVTGRAVPNFGKLYAAEGHAWVVLHVLRVTSSFRKQFEKRSQAVAEREMGARGLALHAKPRTEVVNSTLQREAQGARNTSAVEQAAGLVKERTFEDGKSMFRGVVGVVDEAAQWAVISGNVFLDVSYIRSKWGQVAIGDVVYGLIVPAAVGGCDWRCIHVTKVDVGGQALEAETRQLEERIRADEATLQAEAEALGKEDHKAAIEKLKTEMAEKREEAQRKREEERRARHAARETR